MFLRVTGSVLREEKSVNYEDKISIPLLPVVRGDAAGDDLTPRSPPPRPSLSARLLPHLHSLTGQISFLSQQLLLRPSNQRKR